MCHKCNARHCHEHTLCLPVQCGNIAALAMIVDEEATSRVLYHSCRSAYICMVYVHVTASVHVNTLSGILTTSAHAVAFQGVL